MDAGLDRSGTSSKEKRLHLANHQKDLMNAANHFCINRVSFLIYFVKTSVVDPDSKEPYVYGPPGSWAVIICTDQGSSINKQKKVRKILIATIFEILFAFLYLKTDVKVRYLKKVISKKTVFNGLDRVSDPDPH